MKKQDLQSIFAHYKKRFPYFNNYAVTDAPKPETQFRIVIPCYNEPNLIATLNSLKNCQTPNAHFEVIVVVNQSAEASEEINKTNQKTIADFKDWKAENTIKNIDFYCIEALDLPPKKAGVGLARKIGMDEALRRFSEQNQNGWIVCTDADCVVSENYFLALEKACQPKVRGGHFYFEHNLKAVENDALRQGILLYELHLRYYSQALKFAGFAFYHHTVGSCMFARADVYALQGGMNQRKAGEDFYFMHKILPGGNCVNINEATVFPSARISDRVPFGTGKAQGDWLESENLTRETYNFEIFVLMQKFFNSFESWLTQTPGLPNEITAFLNSISFEEKVVGLRKRSSNKNVFIKNMVHLCDGFFTLKMVHFLSKEFLPKEELTVAAAKLLSVVSPSTTAKTGEVLLQEFRVLDRENQ